MAEHTSQDFAQLINDSTTTDWRAQNGLMLVRATRDEVIAEMEVKPQHLQPYGIVHGGVHASIIETLASVGGAIDAMSHGRSVVGLENHTSFLRAVRGGKLRAVAKPLTRGRRTQVWEASVHDEAGRVAATGRVRLLVLEAGAELAGEAVQVKP
jgi:1,4-dihydroxy-2-naphthoyl-CoA hydrolase